MKRIFKFCPLCKDNLRQNLIESRTRLVCQKCGWTDYQNPVPVAVCAAINADSKILIVKRNQEPGKNKWALPGGFIESNEDPEKACLRELKEETGVEGEIIKLAGVYLRKTKIYGSLIVIGYAIRVLKEDISVNSELKDAKFFSRKDLPCIPFLAHRKIIEKVFEDTFLHDSAAAKVKNVIFGSFL